MSGFGGVSGYEVRWRDELPIGVEITLKGDVTAYVDLMQQRVDMVSGAQLKPKKRDWVLQIAVYLARQALLEVQEEENKKRKKGRANIEFEPRPDPNIIWWG